MTLERGRGGLAAHSARGNDAMDRTATIAGHNGVLDDNPVIAPCLKAPILGVPSVRALFETTYLAGLRKAAMPEE